MESIWTRINYAPFSYSSVLFVVRSVFSFDKSRSVFATMGVGVSSIRDSSGICASEGMNPLAVCRWYPNDPEVCVTVLPCGIDTTISCGIVIDERLLPLSLRGIFVAVAVVEVFGGDILKIPVVALVPEEGVPL